MAAVDSPAPQGAQKGKRKRRRRVGVRIDMTPMVDVAFLLLTFFMLTTVFSRPQAMEINIPESDTPIELAQSNMLIVRAATDGRFYYTHGLGETEVTTLEGLHDILVRYNEANDKLVTLVKVDREGDYATAVNLLDELQLANVTRFSLAPMTPEDHAAIASAGGPPGPGAEAAPTPPAPGS
jgi:biopolymer transport protein ExbD